MYFFEKSVDVYIDIDISHGWTLFAVNIKYLFVKLLIYRYNFVKNQGVLTMDEIARLIKETSVDVLDYHNLLLEEFQGLYTNVVLYVQDKDNFIVNVVDNNNDNLINKIKSKYEQTISSKASSELISSYNSKENPIMAGVPAISFEKHLARIIAEQKYTIAIVRQKGIPPNVSRYLDVVVSPGTNFDFVVDQDDNFITSIVVDQIRGNYLIGYSAIDVTTAKCYYNEVFGTAEDKFFALDEVFNYMNMHKTSEVIVTIADKNINQKEIIDYLELNLKSYHLRNFRPKISYQNELFKNVFSIESLLTPIEHLDMERSPLSTESLAILIDFVIAHDSAIIQKLSNPIKLDVSRYIYLGNNALEQLNIIDTSHNPSLIKLMNNTSTAMGKRLLKERLTNPIKDAKELLRRYNLSKELYDYHSPIENELANIYDIERLTRRIKLARLHPFELNYLYDSLLSIKEIVKFMENYKFISPPCSSEEVDSFIKSINSTFDLSISGKFMLKDVDTNMITSGINTQIDELNRKNVLLFSKLEIIKEHILGFLKSEDESYVTINRLDKEGFFLGLTKNRFNLIKDELLKSHLIIDDELLLFKDFTIKTQTNSVKIFANGAIELKLSCNHTPTPGVYSLGLKTTVFPAASA